MQLLTQFRHVLPKAAGAQLSDEELSAIVVKAKAQCTPLYDGRDRSWINTPSNQNALLFSAVLYGPRTRKFGALSRMTHIIGVGHATANFAALQTFGISADHAGFVGLNHDLVEDGRKYTPSNPFCFTWAQKDNLILRTVAQAWDGNAALRGSIVSDLRSLTDSANLHGNSRYIEQMTRAIERDADGHNYSALTTVVRYNDKADNTGGDLELVRRGIISKPEDIRERAELAAGKIPLVQVLMPPITGKDKVKYYKMAHELGRRAANAEAALALKEAAARVAQPAAVKAEEAPVPLPVVSAVQEKPMRAFVRLLDPSRFVRRAL